MSQLVVQKYGGSVLRDESSFGDVARRIARSAREGRSVVAVVSARAGITDALLARARATTPTPSVAALDLLLGTGEMESAALLTLALEAEGVAAEALNPWQLGLGTDGVHGDARLTRVNPLPLRLRLAETPVLVVPGFLG